MDESGNKAKNPISFLGTRYMATTDNCIRVIHATQTVIINHTGKVFFFDYGNEDEQKNMQKGFMFKLSGWLIPKDAIYGFLEIYMENDVNRDDWKNYYRQIGFFDDFEGTGTMLVSLEDL